MSSLSLPLCAFALNIFLGYRTEIFLCHTLSGYEPKQRRSQITNGWDKGEDEGHGVLITMDAQGQKEEERTKEKYPHDFGYFR